MQQSLPFTLEDYGGIDNVYVDKGPEIGFVSAYYTPYGIKLKDAEYTNRIVEISKLKGVKKERTRKSLRKEIVGDRHLHHVIRDNLLYNLSIR